jgi:hypothetical protein
LKGHIQGRGRLIGNQQLWVTANGHGDHGPLLHAAGKFMGITVENTPIFSQSNQVQKFQGLLHGGFAVCAKMRDQGFGNLLADLIGRIQIFGGFLKNHADALAAYPALFGFGQRH